MLFAEKYDRIKRDGKKERTKRASDTGTAKGHGKFMKILFIGNGLTSSHQMPFLFQELLEKRGVSSKVELLARFGFSLEDFSEGKDNVSSQINETSSRKWDAVFLQEQSRIPLLDKDAFLLGAASLSAKFRPVCDRILLPDLYPYREGHSFYKISGLNPVTMGRTLIETNREIASELDLEPSPVCDAFLFAAQKYPKICLYEKDRFHPSLAGSYLIACVHCAVITSSPVASADFCPEALDPAEAEALRAVADKVVFTPAE